MTTRHLQIPSLQDADLRLLRTFMAVVRNNGFTAAQTELNIGQSTISGCMAQLEARLGVKLCERGRGGFRLTNHGIRVHEATETLFADLDRFRSEVGDIHDQLVGTFQLGMVDAVATMSEAPWWTVLGQFVVDAPGITLKMKIDSPQALVRGLLDGRFDAAVLPIFRRPNQLRLTPIMLDDPQTLYCGSTHEFFHRRAREITTEMLESAPFAARRHMEGWAHPGGLSYKVKAVATDMECLAMLVLSGQFIAYLPAHYARIWVDQGLMKPIFEDELTYLSNLYFAIRKRDPGNAATLLAQKLKRSIRNKQMSTSN